MRPEDIIVNQLSRWLQLQYPDVIFRFDVAAGARLSIGMAIRNKKMNPFHGFPDLLILEPRGKYHGLLLEIKKDGEKLFNKKMNFRTPHLETQHTFHELIKAKNYFCTFGIGFYNCKDIIEKYLQLNNEKEKA